MRPTFEHTVDVLVKAYMNDTLRHGYCPACAVGNMIANSMGIEIVKEDGYGGLCWQGAVPQWDNVFYTGAHPDEVGAQEMDLDSYQGEAKKQIDSTGYTVDELAQIEKAFESKNPTYFHESDTEFDRDEWMFRGLMAVVDVLAEIHNVDLSTKESAKLQFVK